MERILLKERIGDFFVKMYEANKGKKIDVSLDAEKAQIQVYYKDLGSFDYIRIADTTFPIDELVESLSRQS